MTNRRSSGLAAILAAGVGAAALSSCTTPASPALSGDVTPAASGRCTLLANSLQENAPVNGLTVIQAVWRPIGTPIETRQGPSSDLPSHCEVEGYYAEREGRIGGPYRIGFRMRLPEDWNGRFLFEGGGGSNGVVGRATGYNGIGNAPALSRGYAVIAQDSGHDNNRNTVADHGDQLVFGFDPEARRNYGHASLKPTYDLGRHALRVFYGRDSDNEFFWGCSKGGQEGMAFAQRYPDAFDGIFSMAPGMSLPRAALAEAWDTQQFATILSARGTKRGLATLVHAFSDEQLGLISEAVVEACDADDGAKDGMIGAIGQCTTARVLPALRARQCTDAGGTCLEPTQIDALVKVMDGVTNSKGEILYAPWPWDAAVGEAGWRSWKIGAEPGPPALNVVLGAGSLAAVFTTPPTALSRDQLFDWQLAFDFDRDAPKIYAAEAPFTTSAWQDVGMRSTDLSAFRDHGGKLIVPHGAGDPVFSLLDTLDWWDDVDAANGGDAARFARVFPVPGMNHCQGGPATDHFDGLAALEDWVLNDKAPDAIPATAGTDSPWPGRQRPLCPWPTTARTTGDGEGFDCG